MERRRGGGCAGLLVIILVVGLLASVFDGGDDESNPEERAAPTTVEEAAGGRRPERDTGRMSGGEFDEFERAEAEFREEVSAFAEELSGKCAVLASGGELAAFSECAADAYDGVDGQAGLTRDTFGDLLEDVAKSCRTALRRQTAVFDDFYASISTTGRLAEDLALTGELAEVASEDLTRKRRAYERRHRRTTAVCRP